MYFCIFRLDVANFLIIYYFNTISAIRLMLYNTEPHYLHVISMISDSFFFFFRKIKLFKKKLLNNTK